MIIAKFNVYLQQNSVNLYLDMGISKELTEDDVKFRYINEAITSKEWPKDSIYMEQKVKFTDGKISLHGNLVHREKPKFADYVLYANKATPIAIVEAKDANHSVSHGLQQAMTYAQMLDVKFAYSSNGEGFAEHDFLTGKERTFAMDEFPTKEELIERYKSEANDGNGLNEQELAVIDQPFALVRIFFHHDIINAMQSTAQSMPLRKDKTVCSLSWQLAQVRHILHSRLYGVYLKVD